MQYIARIEPPHHVIAVTGFPYPLPLPIVLAPFLWLQHGRTPLMEAAIHGQHKTAEVLIRAGANTEAIDDVSQWQTGVPVAWAFRVVKLDKW